MFHLSMDSQSDKAAWKIGWGEADITPVTEPVPLHGQYYTRESRGIHSRLAATVLAVQSGDSAPSLFVSLDSLGIRKDFMEELREALQERLPELDPSRLIVCVTHTHSSVGLFDLSGKKSKWGVQSPDEIIAKEYRELVAVRVADAAEQAWKSRAIGGLAPAADFAVVGHCRRAVYADGLSEMYGDTSREDFVGMEGGEDSTVELLFTCDVDKNVTGVVVNVACPSQVMEASYVISSDFMGELRRLLKEKYGENFRILCQISASGCQSPRVLTRNVDDEFWGERGVRILGRRLFDAVVRGAEQIPGSLQLAGSHMHLSREVRLPRRRVSYSEYKAACKELERLEQILPTEQAFEQFVAEVHDNEKIPGRPGPYDSKLHHFVLIRNQKAVLQRYADQVAEPDCPVELHILRLGDTVFATNPFELFLDFGQSIQARSAAPQTIVVQLACDYTGYLPTEVAEKHGGYGGLVINGQVGAPGGRMLVDETVTGIEEVFRQ